MSTPVASDIKLDIKLAGELQGTFVVPSYQRGYRWGKTEVTQLLDDIYDNGERSYCLQPVVVREDKKEKQKYELIDGQQRLTTLWILLQYLKNKEEYKLEIEEIKFSLTYDIREESAEYLKKITDNYYIPPWEAKTNIDFYHMYCAHEAIRMWFLNKHVNAAQAAQRIYTCLKHHVKIIWYEVGPSENPADEAEDSISVFIRLNSGKIPLTSAELVKAMLLSQAAHEDSASGKQQEIALQWGDMEKELHDDAFWCFLTSRSGERYKTRMDLVLDLIYWTSPQKGQRRDELSAFFHFDDLKKKKSLDQIWKEIRDAFLTLKDWYEDRDLYHKIGYLITTEQCSLADIYNLSKSKEKQTKDEFIAGLDEEIWQSVSFSKNGKDGENTDISALSYENEEDRAPLRTLLLLFNVESVRRGLDEQTERFPFEHFTHFKGGGGSKTKWTLEHIHAQRAEELPRAQWAKWLEMHIPSVKTVGTEKDSAKAADLARRMEETKKQLEEEAKTKQEKQGSPVQPADRKPAGKPRNAPDENAKKFKNVQAEVLELLSEEGIALHTIGNLALLKDVDNVCLSNAAFDVKRNEIIKMSEESKMSKDGTYIPFCTRMAFLKHYTPSEKKQIHFWGAPDQQAYVQEIRNVLRAWLPEPNPTAKEETRNGNNTPHAD